MIRGPVAAGDNSRRLPRRRRAGPMSCRQPGLVWLLPFALALALAAAGLIRASETFEFSSLPGQTSVCMDTWDEAEGPRHANPPCAFGEVFASYSLPRASIPRGLPLQGSQALRVTRAGLTRAPPLA